MPDISIHRFENISSLNKAVAALLKHHFEREYPAFHAVMLSGGRTPFEAYRLLADEKSVVSAGLRLFFSDERLVPITSAESNFSNMQFMIKALNLNENQLIRVDSELNPASSAERYDRDLRKFINNGGVIPLGLLGLGPDGHTASLFCKDDLEHAKGRYAVPVIGPNGTNRISVSPDLLGRIEQIIFVVFGPEKKAVVERLIDRPASVIAGLAVAGVKNKQLWFAV